MKLCEGEQKWNLAYVMKGRPDPPPPVHHGHVQHEADIRPCVRGSEVELGGKARRPGGRLLPLTFPW